MDGEVYINSAGGKEDRGVLAAHIADLDAHTRDIFEEVRTGEYFFPFHGEHSTSAIAANRLHAVPFIVPRAMTFDRIGISITAGGAGGSKARLGIYSDGANITPGALLLDAGEVAADGVAVVACVINLALTKGLYWPAVVSDDTPTLRSTYSTKGIMGLKADWQLVQGRWHANFAYGVLSGADPFPGAPTAHYDCLTIAMRVASLD